MIPFDARRRVGHFTASVLALFIVVGAPAARSLEGSGIGKVAGIILEVFGAMLMIAYTSFLPYSTVVSSKMPAWTGSISLWVRRSGKMIPKFTQPRRATKNASSTS